MRIQSQRPRSSTGSASALVSLAFTSVIAAQSGWSTTTDELDTLSSDLTAPTTFVAEDLFGEGTLDGLLHTDQGPFLIYGLGRYQHQGLITLATTTVGLGVSHNGPGVPVTAFTLENDTGTPGLSNVKALAPDWAGLASGVSFASQEVMTGRSLTAWSNPGLFGVVSAIEELNGNLRAAYFLSTQPGSIRFTGMAAEHIDIGSGEVRQDLLHDFLGIGDPYLIDLYVDARTGTEILSIRGLFTDVLEQISGGPADGRFCVCPSGSGCGLLYWVGVSGNDWIGRRVEIVYTQNQNGEQEVDLQFHQSTEILAPYSPNMGPLRDLEFVDMDGTGNPVLCVTFDDRILITSPFQSSAQERWLPDVAPADPTTYSNSSPAAIVDLDEDGDLDVAVVYANATGTGCQSVIHENLFYNDSGLAPSLVGQAIAYAGAPYHTLTIETDPGADPDWNEIEVVVYDVSLGRDYTAADLAALTQLPEFDPVAVARGSLNDGEMVGSRWHLTLGLPTDTGLSTTNDGRLALIEMRRRYVPSGTAPEQPLMGPSTFYVADLSPVGGPFDPDPGTLSWSLPVDRQDLQIPVDVRPEAETPVIRILTHRPPRRGPRPNPDPGATGN